MSHTVGYVLLASSSVPGVMGYRLSKEGLKEVREAAKNASNAAKQVAQQSVAVTRGGDTERAVGVRTVEGLADVSSQLGDVHSALEGLTGRLAPARVCFALATVLVVGALFALGVISGSVSSGETTTTVTTAM
jgi:hypothetical protein